MSNPVVVLSRLAHRLIGEESDDPRTMTAEAMTLECPICMAEWFLVRLKHLEFEKQLTDFRHSMIRIMQILQVAPQLLGR